MLSTMNLGDRVVEWLTMVRIPASVATFIWICVPIVSLMIGATLGVLVLVWLERKISAAVQQRIGPEYAGPLGVIQALADGLKLLLKEDIVPARGDSWLFALGPVTVVIPVLLSYLVIPFSHHLILANIGLGLFFWIAVSSITPLGLLVAGYGSNNKYSFLGGLRAAAQSISYEIPLALCVLSITLMSQSLSTVDIVEQQARFGILGWNLWRQPIGMIVFFLASLAECERLPFDLPEAEEELVAGYQTEYSGIRFGLFYVASYLNLFVSSLFVTVLYLGGWDFSLGTQTLNGLTEILEQVVPVRFITLLGTVLAVGITLTKAYLFLFLSILTRWTLPRVRIDQLLDLGWKFLLPVSLGNLILTAAFQLTLL